MGSPTRRAQPAQRAIWRSDQGAALGRCVCFPLPSSCVSHSLLSHCRFLQSKKHVALPTDSIEVENRLRCSRVIFPLLAQQASSADKKWDLPAFTSLRMSANSQSCFRALVRVADRCGVQATRSLRGSAGAADAILVGARIRARRPRVAWRAGQFRGSRLRGPQGADQRAHVVAVQSQRGALAEAETEAARCACEAQSQNGVDHQRELWRFGAARATRRCQVRCAGAGANSARRTLCCAACEPC